jgi:hypothetical protein
MKVIQYKFYLVIAVKTLNCQNSKDSYALDVNHIIEIIHDKFLNAFIGDLGVEFQKISLDTATYKFNLALNNSSQFKNYILVSKSVPFLNNDKLFYGDIILKLGNQLVFDNITLIQTILNQRGENYIDSLVSRNGKIINVTLKINNARTYFSDKYYLISNNIYLQELSPLLRMKIMNIFPDPKGMIFNIPTKRNSSNNDIKRILINRINNIQIDTFEKLLSIFKESCNLKNLLIEGYDLISKSLFLNSMKLDISQIIINNYKYDYDQTKWMKIQEYNSSSICNKISNIKEETILLNNTSQQSPKIIKPILLINETLNNTNTPQSKVSNISSSNTNLNSNLSNLNNSQTNLNWEIHTKNLENYKSNNTDTKGSNYTHTNKTKENGNKTSSNYSNISKELQNLFDRIESINEKIKTT